VISGHPTGAKRKVLLAAAAAFSAVAVPAALSTQAGASAKVTDPGPSCWLDTSNIGIQTSTSPGSVSLIGQDSVLGLTKQHSTYHINATGGIVHQLGGTTAPVETTFTQSDTTYGASGSITVYNTAKQKAICLAQFKSLTNGGRVESTGFGFPSDRNNLVIDNSSSAPLTSVNVQINTGCQFDLTLTPGEVWQTNMADLDGTGVNCLVDDTEGSSTLNSVTLTGWDSGSTVVGAGLAEALVWGEGPFVYSPLPE
jgi:hypothetical protein